MDFSEDWVGERIRQRLGFVLPRLDTFPEPFLGRQVETISLSPSLLKTFTQRGSQGVHTSSNQHASDKGHREHFPR